VSAKHKDKRKPVRKRKRFHLDKRADAILKAIADGDDDELLTPKETARLLGNSEVWLSKRRRHGDGPPYERLSPHCIRYRRGKLYAFIEQRTFTSTAQYEHAKPGKPLDKKREEERGNNLGA
jgi:hypothetical protein